MAYNENTNKNHHSDDGLGLGYAQNPKPISSSSPSLTMFNRSMTLHSSAYEFTKKPILQAHERNGSIKKLHNSSFDSFKGKVKQLCSIFEKQPKKSSNLQSLPLSTSLPPSKLSVSGTEDRVVIYFTSLRGVRRTFQDCSYVRMIFKGFRIYIDERDVSMHSAYRKELLNIFGEKGFALPQVFIKGKHIGSVDVIRQLHETGELAKMLKGFPIRTIMKDCDECGDVRFVPCINCSGSRKVFDEDEEQVRRCLYCNENGLVQCLICNVG